MCVVCTGATTPRDRDSLPVFQKDRVSAGRWHAPGSVNLNRVLRVGWANHVSQESCSCRDVQPALDHIWFR